MKMAKVATEMSVIISSHISPVITRTFSTKRVGIVGACLKRGQSKDGVDKAPDALRKYGLVKELQDLGADVKDYGNVQCDDIKDSSCDDRDMKFPSHVSAACHKVSTAVRNVLRDQRKCVTIGGDHSTAMGTVHGHSLLHDVCVLWVDAHADINTPHTSTTGHIHGMPCSFLIKETHEYHKKQNGFEWLNPCLGRSNIAYIGLRDIDPLEKLILKKQNILHFSMRDVDRLGIFEVTHRALEAINPKGQLSLHVSFDIDAIDKAVVPSTGTPVVGGLTVREAMCIAEEVSTLDSFRALDMVEINPEIGTQQESDNTISIGALLIKAFLGYSRGGTLPLDVEEVPVPSSGTE